MAPQAPNGLCFFRILLRDFSEKLMLPLDFTDPKIKRTRREIATLFSPNGGTWNLELFRGPKKVHIGGERWRDFTAANKLGVGYFLVFHFRGNNEFGWRAFGSNTLEISYPASPPIQKGQKSNKKLVSNNAADMKAIKRQREEDQDGYERGSLGTEKLGFEVIIEAPNCCPKIPTESGTLYDLLKEHEEATIRDPEGNMWTVGLLHCSKSHTFYFSNGWSELASANEVQEGSRCVFELVQQADTDKLMMSVEILTSASGACFGATILASNNKYMNIPIWFLKSAGMKDCTEAMLRDPKGRLWKVGINQRHVYAWRAEMSVGWRKFAKANQLAQGDRCIFQLVTEGRQSYIQVEIIKKQNMLVS